MWLSHDQTDSGYSISQIKNLRFSPILLFRLSPAGVILLNLAFFISRTPKEIFVLRNRYEGIMDAYHLATCGGLGERTYSPNYTELVTRINGWKVTQNRSRKKINVLRDQYEYHRGHEILRTKKIKTRDYSCLINKPLQCKSIFIPLWKLKRHTRFGRK